MLKAARRLAKSSIKGGVHSALLASAELVGSWNLWPLYADRDSFQLGRVLMAGHAHRPGHVVVV